jgi:hypothetical protein
MVNGRVVESGTHEALLARPDGVYCALVRRQREAEANADADAGSGGLAAGLADLLWGKSGA